MKVTVRDNGNVNSSCDVPDLTDMLYQEILAVEYAVLDKGSEMTPSGNSAAQSLHDDKFVESIYKRIREDEESLEKILFEEVDGLLVVSQKRGGHGGFGDDPNPKLGGSHGISIVSTGTESIRNRISTLVGHKNVLIEHSYSNLSYHFPARSVARKIRRISAKHNEPKENRPTEQINVDCTRAQMRKTSINLNETDLKIGLPGPSSRASSVDSCSPSSSYSSFNKFTNNSSPGYSSKSSFESQDFSPLSEPSFSGSEGPSTRLSTWPPARTSANLSSSTEHAALFRPITRSLLEKLETSRKSKRKKRPPLRYSPPLTNIKHKRRAREESRRTNSKFFNFLRRNLENTNRISPPLEEDHPPRSVKVLLPRHRS